MKTCCFTGHRDIPTEDKQAVTARLRQTLVELIEQGVQYFGAGGALGFDTLAAQTVLDLKAIYPHVRLILVLPCKEQADRWSAANKAVYERILLQADKVVWTAEHYHGGCMLLRNRHLVDHADVCVCYLQKHTGGTAYTVNYARQKSIPVINVAY